MDVEEVLRRRWRATGLPTRRPGSACGVAGAQVRRLGGVQAQDFEATLWSLGRRTGERRAEVLRQFQEGEFVRTHALRQTWHFVHREDLEWVQAATAPRVQRLNAAVYQQEGLDAEALARAGEVIRRVTAEGPVTRAQVGARLTEAGFALTPFRLAVLMMWAELGCLVVSGPLVGRQHTYVAWRGAGSRPDGHRTDRAEAIVRLADVYLRSHGPASLADFTAWSSLSLAEARDAVGALEVERETVEGVELLSLGDVTAGAWATPQVELLNAYDEYVSGFTAAGKRWMDRDGLRAARPGVPIALVVADGRLAGHWRRSVRKGRVVVEVLMLRAFDAGELAALEEHVASYGRFLDSPVTLEVRALARGR